MSHTMSKAERLVLIKEAHAKVMKRKMMRDRNIERWLPPTDYVPEEFAPESTIAVLQTERFNYRRDIS